jgi:hypothetical protein
MITREQADHLAEQMIVEYCDAAGARTPDEVRKVTELLISKSALAIVKYCGGVDAQMVLTRTMLNVVKMGGQG